MMNRGWGAGIGSVENFVDFYLDPTKRLLGAHATDHRKVVVLGATNGPIPLKIGKTWFTVTDDINVDATSNLDTGTLQNGKDYRIYACNNNGTLIFLTSLNSTYPAGYTADNSRKIGGFHTECADVGTISGHPLSDYLAKDIIPMTIWDLRHRASCGDQTGLTYDVKTNLWVDIYGASSDGNGGVQSVYNAPWLDTITWNDIVDAGYLKNKRLLSDEESQSYALGSNEQTNIQGSADPVTTGGHVDTAGRRMISNIAVEDACGALNHWTNTQSYQYGQNASNVGDSAAGATITVYYAATPGGNQIYVKWDNNIPYLCCNFATAQADKVLSFGSNQKFLVKHDANASTGLPVYINYNATNVWEKLLINNTLMGKDVYLETNFPAFQIKCKHDASASTNGVALKYDDGSDNRLEAALPNAANTTFDLATMGPNWAWKSLPSGSHGQFYGQGPNGDTKLLAGGDWFNGSVCGSRYRGANASRWCAGAAIGGRFASEPI